MREVGKKEVGTKEVRNGGKRKRVKWERGKWETRKMGMRELDTNHRRFPANSQQQEQQQDVKRRGAAGAVPGVRATAQRATAGQRRNRADLHPQAGQPDRLPARPLRQAGRAQTATAVDGWS